MCDTLGSLLLHGDCGRWIGAKLCNKQGASATHTYIHMQALLRAQFRPAPVPHPQTHTNTTNLPVCRWQWCVDGCAAALQCRQGKCSLSRPLKGSCKHTYTNHKTTKHSAQRAEHGADMPAHTHFKRYDAEPILMLHAWLPLQHRASSLISAPAS